MISISCPISKFSDLYINQHWDQCLSPSRRSYLFGDMTLDGASVENKSYSSSGFVGLTILVGIWLISNAETKTWLGVIEWFKFPIGEYDNNKVLNMGSNQWAFKTELGFEKG
jgi:hypothetical protein